jgi:hypothetical protein
MCKQPLLQPHIIHKNSIKEKYSMIACEEQMSIDAD